MGRTLLLQWSLPPNPARTQASLSEYVLSRCLEHYGPVRTSISIRTYRATFRHISDAASLATDASPTHSATSSGTQRTLSIMVYSEPILPSTAPSAPGAPGAAQSQGQAQTQSGMGVRDDTSYVFIEDRGGPSSARAGVADAGSGSGGIGVGVAADVTQPSGRDGDEDFEIVDPPGVNAARTAQRTTGADADAGQAGDTSSGGMGGTAVSYQTIALRPAAAVVPLLHQITSPFVLGATKSARAAASTTAEKATATKLPGTLFTLNTYTFPPMTAPYPSIVLSVHVLPGQQTGMIILEAELLEDPGVDDDRMGGEDVAYGILKEFLEGCVPELPPMYGVDAAVANVIDPHTGRSGYLEKMRKVSGAMARMLRDAGHI